MLWDQPVCIIVIVYPLCILYSGATFISFFASCISSIFCLFLWYCVLLLMEINLNLKTWTCMSKMFHDITRFLANKVKLNSKIENGAWPGGAQYTPYYSPFQNSLALPNTLTFFKWAKPCDLHFPQVPFGSKAWQHDVIRKASQAPTKNGTLFLFLVASANQHWHF